MPKVATCHPDRPYFAKGLCHVCYDIEYRRVRKAEEQAWLQALRDRLAPVPEEFAETEGRATSRGWLQWSRKEIAALNKRANAASAALSKAPAREGRGRPA